MCSSLTDKVQSVAKVTTAVVWADLMQKMRVRCNIEANCQFHGGPTECVRLTGHPSHFGSWYMGYTRGSSLCRRRTGYMGWFDQEHERILILLPSVEDMYWSSVVTIQGIASNLTDQVWSTSDVTKVVALGDPSKVVNVHGEMFDLRVICWLHGRSIINTCQWSHSCVSQGR